MNKKIWAYTTISSDLKKRDGIGDYNKKVEELKEASSELAPEGNLIVYLFDVKTKYRYYEKAVMNLSLIPKIFNERALFSDPESAVELQEIKLLLGKVNKIIDKQKKRQRRPNDKN